MEPRARTAPAIVPAVGALRPPDRRRVAVRVTPDALRQVRSGHPWVFEGSITTASHDAAPGDLAVVFDRERRFAAIGLWDPASPIRVRVLHQGSPAPIDTAWFRAAIGAAIARRAVVAADPSTTGWRVVHGENDGLPGLVVDRYGATAVLKLYSAAWFPHLPVVVPVLLAALTPDRLVLRLARSVSRDAPAGLGDGSVMAGPDPAGPVPYLEHGLRFEAEVRHGQKTGAFLDQRDNRALVGAAAAGARVLDVFACAGGFSTHAAAGGARSVHVVDASPAAVASARRSLELNRDRAAVARCAVRTTVGDAFEVLDTLGAAGERYDVVVVDPPSFASRQADVPGALRAYRALTRLAVGLLDPGGLLVQASCSSRVGTDEFVAAVHDAARRAGRPLREERVTAHPGDHPVGFAEGAYLKAVFGRVPG
jgi:23S rRNA (cytosine1962-C5)-methyltransferase